MSNLMPPIPYREPIADENRQGRLPQIWSDWFRELLVRIGGPTLASAAIANGYQKLPSGLVIQWGITSSVSSGATHAVTLPTPFPTVCLQVMPGLRNMSAANTTETGHYGTGNYTAAGFDIFNRTSAAYIFNWLAVGY